jgi:hypothetical protein
VPKKLGGGAAEEVITKILALSEGRIDSPRFQVLKQFNDEAVLDRETGLVWERRPTTERLAWPTARLVCAQKGVGGRGGWRLPAFYELTSLVDPSVRSTPQLPVGHPFLDVQAVPYWTDTPFAEEPGFVLAVSFLFVSANAGQINVHDHNLGSGPCPAWAVRGGSASFGSY